MKLSLLAAGAAMALAAGAAQANPLDDAKAGLAALDKGDDPAAVRLFTAALDSKALTRADEELAYVKRAEAHLAANEGAQALVDADRALNLDPRDAEAAAARDRAKSLLDPAAATPTAVAATGPDYAAAVARFEAEKKADADRYAQQVAAYDAKVKAQDAKRQADLAAWRAEACKAGDLGKCEPGSQPTQTAKAAPTKLAEPAPAKPQPAVTQVAVKSAPKPAQKPAALPAPVFTIN